MGPTDEHRGGRARPLRAAALAVGVLALVGTALVHLHLWMHGYRSIATIGTLFLLQWIAGFVLAAVVVVWHRWFVPLVGALFLASTVGGLLLSVEVGLFGFTDSLGAPYAGMSIVVEAVGFVALATAAVLMFLDRRRPATALRASQSPAAPTDRSAPAAGANL
ncbi:MAG TPA: hypothetical protein VEI83_15050 [Acidimicrobiales bacterium]|nr:hypothetical protein [Acidimicrobiales bacterium]